ncbi:thrombospondin type 3 repeat-containing protein [Muricauda sp. SCSIO 64092]|uniref:thrombospondin type 3 repeat-containing protein n=1 Tax=Allomuricauda sp. SCSIO 64092 TaxID=2908842 RepID=UPI001FF4041C|nr:thrombospondin type 3 repeat-containing protein [Muricauda sp. SCSIO 64092]UOY06084.1 thrombospondin type 3 repeat-containing protein [Muricauda sp. SCSIO 64092]
MEIQNANDGSNRLFVVEQPGRIRVFPNNSSSTGADVNTFLDLTGVVDYTAGLETGLLGLAFHPNFSQNGFFYVYYLTWDGRYEMNLSRYTVSPSDPNVADPSSEVLIFQFEKNQSESNHNGGKIAFGPDGYLYVSIGDGGGAGDPLRNAQNLNTVFGSILRIDVDVNGDNPVETNPELPNGNYEIPADNPRVGQSGLDELYAWGIRNTWKFSFDSNILWGADVGQGNIEEINIISNGGNYGWNRFEGTSNEDLSTNLVTTPDIKPIYEYNHDNGDVSVTGGYVYRGSSTDPLIQGKYIYGDYVSGRVWALDYNASTDTATSEFLFRTSGQFISSFGLDEAGELYFSDYGSSAGIYSISGTNSGPVTVAVDGVGSWNALGSGTNGIVEIIANDGNDNYYVGGEFTNAGGLTVNNLAIYNSSSGWSALGSGTNGKVNTIAIANNGDVYIGGDFSEVGGVSASNIAVWNGTNWSALGSGTNGPVAKLGIDSGNSVYVGGAFETAGGTLVNNIAVWENNGWSPLTDSGNGISGTNNEIRAINFDENDNLYVGGNFDLAGGNSAPRIATWDGNNWGTLGLGTSGFVQAIAITNDYIYAGGNFSIAGSQTVNRIARWNRNTNSWQSLNNGLSGNVNSLQIDGAHLYVGGSFETASDETDINEIMNNIARWSENDGWEALGTNTSVGMDIRINSLEFSNDNTRLFAGGNFSNAGQIRASNIALWSLIPILQDDDNDGVNNAIDLCPNTPNGESVDADGCSPSQLDDDNDGVNNDMDLCPNTPNGESVDADGCSPSQLDDDNDGVNNDVDLCPNTPNGESVDADGCSPSQLDDDNDGVNNDMDLCPNTPNGQAVNADGCAQSQLDDDNDNVPNSLDICPNTPNGQTVNADGCAQSQLDDDNDNVPNSLDICPNTPNGQTVNADGCAQSQLDDDNDNVPNSLDFCPNTPMGEIVDATGCAQSQLDDDNDGINNEIDQCPNTPNGEMVNSNGCAPSELDDDNDGVNNDLDQCPNTPDGATVDAFGCVTGQNDGDLDGIPNNLDLCPNTPVGATVNADGCSQSQLDLDNDGVNNSLDQCPNTPISVQVDSNGCADTQLDDDNDHVSNDLDLCPNTPDGEVVNANGCSQSQLDDDNDGVTNNIDFCPSTPLGAQVDANGCTQSQLDDDNDHVSNDLDQCPNTPAGQIVNSDGCAQSELDTDNDGITNDIDLCPNTPAGETVNSEGCAGSELDDDNDGVTNDLDLCPNTPPDTMVDNSGCEITIPADNFTINTVGLSCIGANDGQIIITSRLSFTYMATLSNAASGSQEYTFNESLDINDLAVGTYDLCITTTDFPDFESCFVVVIVGPELLSVSSSLNVAENSLTLIMSGGTSYSITLNGTVFTTNRSEIVLDLKQDSNTLMVSTEKDCLGLYEETILLSEGIRIYPNPFDDVISIAAVNSDTLDVKLDIFTISGELLYSNGITIESGGTEVPLHTLQSGVYVISLKYQGKTRVFKLLKK